MEFVEWVLDVRDGPRGHMGVDLRGFGAGVAQDGLDDAQVRSALEQVGAVRESSVRPSRQRLSPLPQDERRSGWTECVFLDSGLFAGGAEELLDAFGGVLPTGGAFEQERLGAVGVQVALDQVLEMVRQRDLSVLVVFGLADYQDVALPVDVALAQVHGFGDAQAAGIDQAQGGLVLDVVGAGQHIAHFFHAEHGGEGAHAAVIITR